MRGRSRISQAEDGALFEALVARICRLCKSGLYEPHQDTDLNWLGWRKCPICGNCVKLVKDDEQGEAED